MAKTLFSKLQNVSSTKILEDLQLTPMIPTEKLPSLKQQSHLKQPQLVQMSFLLRQTTYISLTQQTSTSNLTCLLGGSSQLVSG